MTCAHLGFEPPPPRRSAGVHALVDQRLVDCRSAGDEVHALLELCGDALVKDAVAAIGDRLLEALGSGEFEDEVRFGPDMASVRLRRLAALKVRINASGLAEDRRALASAILRRIDDLIHADAAMAGAGGRFSAL